MALLQILRCLDSESFYNYIYQNAGQKRPDAEFYEHQSVLFGWGWGEALSLFWTPAAHASGMPKFPSVDELKNWGDSILQCSGRVRLIEQVLELERIQLGALAQSSDGSAVFDFRLNGNAIGIESIERDEGNYFAERIGRVFESSGAWEKLEKRRQPTMDKMQRLVGVSGEYFIKYDTTPEIDAFYSEFATLVSPTRDGWDAFPLNASFGGVPFVNYIECVRNLMAFAFKHLDYCVLLTTLNRAIKPINVVAVPCKWEHACNFMSLATGEPEGDAARLMELTALGPDNADHHFRIPAGPLAPHYRFGKDWVVRSITGTLHNPFHFVLRELKRRFPADWDKAVDSREVLFRFDMAHAFSRFKHTVFHPRGIDISTSLGKTDIDVFAYDAVHKTAGLFQLKWQDPFCGSMRERESRKRNFLKNGNEWVGKACEWSGGREMARTLISMGLAKDIAEGIKAVKVFVVGRNFSQFSGEFETDPRAAWGNWSQVQRLLDGISVDDAPFEKLYDLLKQEIPANRAPKYLGRTELKVGGITVRIHPADNDSENQIAESIQ